MDEYIIGYETTDSIFKPYSSTTASKKMLRIKIMKNLFILIAAASAMLVSCKKQHPYDNPGDPVSDRRVRFQLYTSKDFSGEASVINFSVFIRDGVNVLLDSSLASMQVRDIPDSLNKIVIDKTVSAKNSANLSAGFRYEIHNVGNSWFIDTLHAGNTFKVIDYDFR